MAALKALNQMEEFETVQNELQANYAQADAEVKSLLEE